MMERRGTLPVIPILIIVGAGLYGAYILGRVLVPFLLAFALAYVVNPLINAVETRGVRRFHIVLGFYLLAAFLLYLLAQYLLPALISGMTGLQADMPGYFTKIHTFFSELPLRVAKHVPHAVLPVAERFVSKTYASAAEQMEYLPSYLMGIFPLLSLFFLVPFITFFLLLDGPDLTAVLIQACPSRHVERALHLISEIDSSLGNYLRGILIVALAITAASYLGLLALGVNAAAPIALLAGASSFVPYLGAVVGALVGGAVAAIQFSSLTAGFKVVLLFAAIRLADEAFLQPSIARYSVRLHPLAFLFSLMAGGELFGFVGLLFAVPAACVIKSLLKVSWDWYLSEAGWKGAAASPTAIPYT